jgi:hypothetical protein
VGQRLLAVINYGPTQGQCFVVLPFVDVRGKNMTLQDLLGEASYERVGDDLLSQVLYLDLAPWGSHVFDSQNQI